MSFARRFFWLHVRKSAGTSIRELLKPEYVEVDRTTWPKTFLQCDPSEYNDNLNNYRVMLGALHLRRCRFAKEFLYGAAWSQLFSFAFAREPVDRCVSMFSHAYLAHAAAPTERRLMLSYIRRRPRSARPTSFRFDAFLHRVEQCREERSLYWPLGLHFMTHTAPMWDDVVDDAGQVLLTRIYRLEALVPALREVLSECGISRSIPDAGVRANMSSRRDDYRPDRHQRMRIEALYAKDFELYETARSPA